MKPHLPLKIAAFRKPFIVEIENKGLNDENCLFSGTMGRSANDLIKYGRFNCTVLETDESEGYGHMNISTSKYDGMNGAVQMGQVDLGLAVQMVPMENDDFLYGPVITSSRITILSTYAAHNSSQDEVLDVSEIFGKIDFNVWATFVVFLFIFFTMLWLGKRVFNASDHVNSLWTIITFACGKESFSHRYNSFFECFVLFLTLFIFLSHQYFSNYMTTELVRPNIPLVIDSFEDILNYRQNNKSLLVDIRNIPKEKKRKHLKMIRPFFLTAIRSIKNFENAKDGTLRQKVYQRALEVNGGRKKSQLDVKDALKDEFILGIYKGTSVIIDAQTVTRIIRVFLCDWMTQRPDYDAKTRKLSRYMLFARNASIPYLLGYVYSRNISPVLRERLDKVIYGFGESGIANKLVIDLSHAIVKYTHRISRCLNDEIFQDDNVVESLGVKHVTYIFMSLGILFLMAAFMIVFEQLLYAYSPKPRKRRIMRRLTPVEMLTAEAQQVLFHRLSSGAHQSNPGSQRRVNGTP